MDFNNFNGYITLINDDLPPNDFKSFKINNIEFQMKVPKEDFELENISDFFIEVNCSLLESYETHKGENLKSEKLLGFITNVKIELQEFLEYNSKNSEVTMFFNENIIGDNILTSNPIRSTIQPYFHLNFAYIFKENEEYLNISLVYTLYLK